MQPKIRFSILTITRYIRIQMLTLNITGDNAPNARATGNEKPRARLADEKHSQADFESYMMALNQPVRAEAPAQQRTAQPENAGSLRSQEEAKPAERKQPDTIYDAGPQKAGHEATTMEKEMAARPTKDAGEVNEARPAAPRSVRAEKELLETLGLSAKVAAPRKAEATTAVTATQKAIQTTATAQVAAQKNPKARAETVTSTLNLLQKTPDLVLSNTDGLKRLGEKLGLAFLGRVSEKIIERNIKTEASPVQKAGEKSELVALGVQPRAQKAGDGMKEGFADSQGQSQSQARSAKQPLLRNVSRETSATEVSSTLRQAQGEGVVMVSPSNHETTTRGGLNSHLHTADLRLSEAAATARTTENIRVAVENPLMRADLVRQFNEIMGRAQVLVTDTQNAQFSVKLFPREIGRMEIDLKMVDGEIRGKIVVESEDVKNEMQNFLKNGDNQAAGEQFDMNKIDIEVRNGNQNAQNPQRTPDADELLQNLVTRAAATTYGAAEAPVSQGNALYA